MSASPYRSETAAVADRPTKPKLLIVDDECDNLDLLFRTFRRDFQVYRAESGVAALEILQDQGEVAVIISDQRMPEMKGTEFLSRTVPQFPDTVRIVLTGFTDVEDLVEAINTGQVHRYITKPWNPDELKGVVLKATETYQLLKERSEELRRAQAQNAFLAKILEVAQTCNRPSECLGPLAAAFVESLGADACTIAIVEDGQLGTQRGTAAAKTGPWVEPSTDPIVQRALQTQQMQVWLDPSQDSELTTCDPYTSGTVRGHIATVAIYRGTPMAILSLQWQTPPLLKSGDIQLIQRCVDEVAIALACVRHAVNSP